MELKRSALVSTITSPAIQALAGPSLLVDEKANTFVQDVSKNGITEDGGRMNRRQQLSRQGRSSGREGAI